MPVANAASAATGATAVFPGDNLKLFDGTENPANAPMASITLNRAPGMLTAPAGIVFTIDFPQASPNATVLIQASNQDVDGTYQTLKTTTSQHDYYADVGNFAYYRAKLSAYVSGGMPVVIAQR